MRGEYLATESSRDTSHGVWAHSGITVKEWARHSCFMSQSASTSRGMRFDQCRLKTVDGRSLFSRTRQSSERKKKETFPKGEQ